MGPSVLPPSHQERQVSWFLSLTFFTSSRLSSELTPSRAKGLSASFFTSDRSCGYMARQGPHQCPQKSSRTTLPLYSESLKDLPSRSSSSMSGAGLPTASLSNSKIAGLACSAYVRPRASLSLP